MNYPLVAKLLGMICWLIGVSMLGSVPWCFPALGEADQFEGKAFSALLISIAISMGVGGLFRWWGRRALTTIYRKEAMAVVGLSWLLATLLGALPYQLSDTRRHAPAGEIIPLTVADALFESQSGFSTTGASVLTDVEDARLVPRSILFWRSTTHFLGGLGIIVLFVAVLGQGSAGKALMRTEMPGPRKEGNLERMQHTAWSFTLIYLVLNAVLTLLLMLEGLSPFDALCHAFGAISTGGFSTYNASIGHFDSELVDYTVLVFMFLGGMNFALLYLATIGRPLAIWRDPEWRAYIGTIVVASLAILIVSLLLYDEFAVDPPRTAWSELRDSVRFVTFQVVSIITTTGYVTHDFDLWHQSARLILLVLMFVGGCAGSTAGGLKVIRCLLFFKVLSLDVELSYRPNVVRSLKLGEEVLEADMRVAILRYFSLILFIFVASTMALVMLEPDATWTSANQPLSNKLLDSASAVASTLNNVGPGLGVVGPMRNFAPFSDLAKLLLTFLMMLGRLELFPLLVLLLPNFWRSR